MFLTRKQEPSFTSPEVQELIFLFDTAVYDSNSWLFGDFGETVL